MKLPGDVSFLRRNWSKRALGWARDRLLYFALLAVLLWTFDRLLTSPDFQVNAALVYGNRMVSASAVVEAASLARQSILLVDEKKIEGSVLRLQQVKGARIWTKLPNQVHIDVIERTPAYNWKAGNILYLVSDDGIVLGTSETANQPIVVVDVDARPVDIGAPIDSDATATASKLSRLLPVELGLSPSYYEYSLKEGIVVPTDFSGRVILGGSENLADKVAAFKAISQKIRQDGLKPKVVDLRFKDSLYLR